MKCKTRKGSFRRIWLRWTDNAQMEKALWHHFQTRRRRDDNAGCRNSHAKTNNSAWNGKRNSKKSRSHIRQNVETMCSALHLNRSSYYKDSKRKPAKIQVSSDELDSKILKVYYESKRHNGVPMIFKAIRNEGQTASLKRSQCRMAVLRIKSVVVKK